MSTLVDKAYLIYSPIINGRNLSHPQPAIVIWIQNVWGSRKPRTWSLAWEVGQVTKGMFPVWILVLGSCLCHSASCLPCVPAAVVFCFTVAPEWAELRQTDTSETMSEAKPSSLLLGFLRCVVTAMTKLIHLPNRLHRLLYFSQYNYLVITVTEKQCILLFRFPLFFLFFSHISSGLLDFSPCWCFGTHNLWAVRLPARDWARHSWIQTWSAK